MVLNPKAFESFDDLVINQKFVTPDRILTNTEKINNQYKKFALSVNNLLRKNH